MKFWVLLNKTEKKHLHEYNVYTISGFKTLRASQLVNEATARKNGRVGSSAVTCYECRDIAKKVGLL